MVTPVSDAALALATHLECGTCFLLVSTAAEILQTAKA
jgi:hypothetical protein